MYRYSIKKHNNALLKNGEIRIGTLHDFRKKEHKTGIGDNQEGRKSVLLTLENTLNKSNDDLARDHESTLKSFQGLEIGGTGAIKEIEMGKHFDSSNCYILCSSKYCSEQTMREFEDADSCIKIINVELFYEIITNTLIQETKIDLKFEGIFEIEYQNREERYNGIDMGYHPSQIKEKKFESQGELRAIWQPLNNEKIDPIIIVNYKIAELCMPIYFD